LGGGKGGGRYAKLLKNLRKNGGTVRKIKQGTGKACIIQKKKSDAGKKGGERVIGEALTGPSRPFCRISSEGQTKKKESDIPCGVYPGGTGPGGG